MNIQQLNRSQQDNDETLTAALQQASPTGDTPIRGIVERTSDLPYGGNWLIVDLDYKDEWLSLPDWMTCRGVWLMESQVAERWYAWMPAPKVEK